MKPQALVWITSALHCYTSSILCDPRIQPLSRLTVLPTGKMHETETEDRQMNSEMSNLRQSCAYGVIDMKAHGITHHRVTKNLTKGVIEPTHERKRQAEPSEL